MADVSGLPDLGPIALGAARAGARAIEEVVGGGLLGTRFKTGSHDMVTDADRASERAIIGIIRAERPEDSILGEEGGLFDGKSGVRWLIDPLDGTANFVYGRSDFAVSVGAEVAGRPVAGAILRPADEQWVAAGVRGVTAGRGAESTMTSMPPAIRDGDLGAALISFGLPYSLSGRHVALTTVAALAPRVRGVRVMGSAAGDLAAVALGQCDAFVGFDLAEWDTSAGQAIVIAAGGSVRHLQQQSGAHTLVAGAGGLVEALIKLLSKT